MLVPEKMVKAWYKKTHPIYKGFKYLFKNELWQKDVPEGFSVCPFFWFGLFGMTGFRFCFVWPIYYIFQPILRSTVAKPFKVVDDFGRNHCPFPITKETGAGIASLILMGFAVSIVGFVLSLIVGVFLGGLVAYGHLPIYYMLWWGIPIGLAIAAASAIFEEKGLCNCSTKYFVYGWGVLMLTGILVFNLASFLNIFIVIGGGISVVVWGIWWCAVKLFVWTVFAAKLMAIPALVVAVILGGLSFLVRFFLLEDDDDSEEKPSTYQREWKQMFVDRMLEDGDFVMNLQEKAISSYGRIGEINHYSKFYDSFKKQFVEDFYEETIRPLIGPLMLHKPEDFGDTPKRHRGSVYGWHCYFDEFVPKDVLSKDVYNFLQQLDLVFGPYRTDYMYTNKCFSKFDKWFLRLSDSLIIDVDGSLERIKAWEEKMARLDEHCAKLAAIIERVLGPIGRLLTPGWAGFINILKFIGQFLAYLWVFAWAQKKKACPYFKFED